MNKKNNFRIRKCSDINLELPYFEVLDENGEIVLDISESDSGERNILFSNACLGISISVDDMLDIIENIGELINKEKEML
jgi:hypothetical protein